MSNAIYGKMEDGTRVVTEVFSLSEFINATPDAYIIVETTDENQSILNVQKSDVEWLSVGEA